MDSLDIQAFRQRLQTEREKRDLSARELSLKAGLSHSYVRCLEVGGGNVQGPGIAVVSKLATVLGVSPAWLAYGTGEKDGQG